MSLRPIEATLIAAELDRELKNASVQQVASPSGDRLYLELRVPGLTVTLLVCSEVSGARVSVVERRPSNPQRPPGWQSVLRRELVGARLLDVESVEPRRLLLLHFEVIREGQRLRPTLVLEYGEPTGIALVSATRVLARSAGFRPGSTWEPPPETPVRPLESRLAGDFVQFRLARASEALFAQEQQTRWLDARVAPLRAKLKKLGRTREKVRAESERAPLAEQYRAEGTLLAQNQHLLVRGAKEVTLTEYAEDGAVERRIALEPSRTAREEVEWRFHQYRRLLRGVAFATKRLAQLDEEERALKQALEGMLATETLEPPASTARRPKPQDVALAPFKTYRGHGGQLIWVGRGSTHNDTLTFHVARPWHVWFHARGVPGAHVVVPLDKRAQLGSETLLDAAHLALHHSDLKGEPRGEVSYVPVKLVRKGRGAAPGAVTYTQERTVMLRVEPERLARLLETETLGPR